MTPSYGYEDYIAPRRWHCLELKYKLTRQLYWAPLGLAYIVHHDLHEYMHGRERKTEERKAELVVVHDSTDSTQNRKIA